MSDLVDRVLFERKQDISQSFQIVKAVLNTQNASQFFTEQTSIRLEPKFHLIGAYGDPQSLSMLLSSYFNTEVDIEERAEQVALLYSNDKGKAALIYSNMQDFNCVKQATIFDNSVILFVRFLFDCCPMVYVCLSDYHLENWYYSKESRLANPFVKKQHKILEVNLQKEESKGSDFRRLKSIFNEANIGSKFALPSDNSCKIIEFLKSSVQLMSYNKVIIDQKEAIQTLMASSQDVVQQLSPSKIIGFKNKVKRFLNAAMTQC